MEYVFTYGGITISWRSIKQWKHVDYPLSKIYLQRHHQLQYSRSSLEYVDSNISMLCYQRKHNHVNIRKKLINKNITMLYSFSLCPCFVPLGFTSKGFNKAVVVFQKNIILFFLHQDFSFKLCLVGRIRGGIGYRYLRILFPQDILSYVNVWICQGIKGQIRKHIHSNVWICRGTKDQIIKYINSNVQLLDVMIEHEYNIFEVFQLYPIFKKKIFAISSLQIQIKNYIIFNKKHIKI